MLTLKNRAKSIIGCSNSISGTKYKKEKSKTIKTIRTYRLSSLAPITSKSSDKNIKEKFRLKAPDWIGKFRFSNKTKITGQCC
jgi:hypothetical protein